MVDVLEITAIETVPIKARLDRVYQGSFYSMPHRATITLLVEYPIALYPASLLLNIRKSTGTCLSTKS